MSPILEEPQNFSLPRRNIAILNTKQKAKKKEQEEEDQEEQQQQEEEEQEQEEQQHQQQQFMTKILVDSQNNASH